MDSTVDSIAPPTETKQKPSPFLLRVKCRSTLMGPPNLSTSVQIKAGGIRAEPCMGRHSTGRNSGSQPRQHVGQPGQALQSTEAPPTARGHVLGSARAKTPAVLECSQDRTQALNSS